MLAAARALASLLRGSSKRRDASIETRTAAIAALAAWQRLEILSVPGEDAARCWRPRPIHEGSDERPARREQQAFPHGSLQAPSFLERREGRRRVSTSGPRPRR